MKTDFQFGRTGANCRCDVLGQVVFVAQDAEQDLLPYVGAERRLASWTGNEGWVFLDLAPPSTEFEHLGSEAQRNSKPG